MGIAKNYWMELQKRGYGEAPDTFVCEECFSDGGLKTLVEESGCIGVCSYCDRESDTVLPLDAVMSHIMESLSTEWMDAADSGTPYETREGGYQGPVFDTYDLLQDEEPIEAESQDLFRAYPAHYLLSINFLSKMHEAARDTKAQKFRKYLQYRVRMLRNALNHAMVRSTTQRFGVWPSLMAQASSPLPRMCPSNPYTNTSM